MRTVVFGLALALACSAPATLPSPTPRLGSEPFGPQEPGYVNGACEPTRRTDTAGVTSATGTLGLLEAPYFHEDVSEWIPLLVWGAQADARLTFSADRLDPNPRVTSVAVPSFLPTPHATPWGDLVYRYPMKPLGEGCWRITLVDPPGGHVVMVVGPRRESGFPATDPERRIEGPLRAEGIRFIQVRGSKQGADARFVMTTGGAIEIVPTPTSARARELAREFCRPGSSRVAILRDGILVWSSDRRLHDPLRAIAAEVLCAG